VGRSNWYGCSSCGTMSTANKIQTKGTYYPQRTQLHWWRCLPHTLRTLFKLEWAMESQQY
jgi:hypothetical protein